MAKNPQIHYLTIVSTVAVAIVYLLFAQLLISSLVEVDASAIEI